MYYNTFALFIQIILQTCKNKPASFTCCTPSPQATTHQTSPLACDSLFLSGYTGCGRAATCDHTPYTRGRRVHTGKASGLENTAGSPWGEKAAERDEMSGGSDSAESAVTE